MPLKPHRGAEHEIFYYHGSLPETDANKLLENEGDFLIQTKYIPGSTHPKIMLAIRTKTGIERLEIERLVNGYHFVNVQKAFSTLRSLMKYYYKHGVVNSRGIPLLLKRPIPRGKYEMTHRDILLYKKIGKGAYGTVYMGILTKCKCPVAVKRIATDGRTDKALQEMMNEARVMQMYSHKNIVKFYGFIVNQPPHLLVMELCMGGSLEDTLRSEGYAIREKRRVNYSMQASRGLEYLHGKKCIHRDIATRNCLLSGGVVKLADFGMCRATVIYKVDLSKPQNVRWLSPEVWRTGETNFLTDIYAFGIMLWEMFECPYKAPYSNWKAYEVKKRVIGGYRMPPPIMMPNSIAKLMRCCCDADPLKRPKTIELRKRLEEINKRYNDVETALSEVSSRASSIGL